MTLEEQLGGILAAAQAEERLPSVSAVVFREGEVVWEEAIGLADAASGERATTEHRYRIGSITKTFTAVAIMQLREEGALSLDAPIRTVVPEFPPGPTFAQALAHLSGIQREPPGEIWETMDAPDREQLLAGLEDAEQVLHPGEAWHYSNLGFAILGEAVVRLSGSYSRHLSERILGPLGLERTSLVASAPAATPYYVHPWTQAVHAEPSFDADESTAAAGWLWSTTGDLARWADFLCEGDPAVLDRRVLDEMSAVKVMIDPGWRRAWGLGLELVRDGDRVLVGHGGAMPGFLAGVFVDRGERSGAAVLMNTTAGGAPKALALELARAAHEGLPRRPAEWRPGEPPSPEVEELLGQWWTEGSELVFTWEAPRLRIDVVGVAETTSWLEPTAPDAWRVVEGRERGELLRVVRGPEGTPAKLYLATYPVTRVPLAFGDADTSRPF